jgi:hypothetical protein
MNEKIERIDKIGIAMTMYNPDPSLFYQQLNSIILQEFTQWECLIGVDADDGKVLDSEPIQRLLEDQRITVSINQNRLGFVQNFLQTALKLIEKTKCEAVIFCDQDDHWFENKLSDLRMALLGKKKFSVAHTDATIQKVTSSGLVPQGQTMWEIERRDTRDQAPEDILVKNTVTGANGLWDARLISEYPQIPSQVIYHDHWYALLSSLLGEIVAVPDSHGFYNQHENNVVGSSEFKGVFERKDKGNLVQTLTNKFFYAKYLLRSLENIGIELPKNCRKIYLFRDLGIGILLRAIKKYSSNPALSRSLIAVGLGKLLAGITFSQDNSSKLLSSKES